MAYGWVIGISLAAGASIISNLGLNLQKLTHNRNNAKQDLMASMNRNRRLSTDVGELNKPEMADSRMVRAVTAPDALRREEPSSRQTPTTSYSRVRSDSETEESATPKESYIFQPLWLLGISLVVLGSIADFIALGFASQIIIAPLGSLTLVANLWFAPYFSGETLTAADKFATFMIILGSAVAVASAPHDEKSYTFEELFGFYSNLLFFFYMFFVATLIWLIWHAVHRIESAMSSPPKEDVDMNLIHNLVSVHWGQQFLLKTTRFGYAAMAGIAGAQSVMFAKGVSTGINDHGFLALTRFETLLLLCAMLLTIFLQIKWLNVGLQYFDALYMVPVFQSFWISFSVIAGLVVYKESDGMTWIQAIGFAVGIGICVNGVYTLSKRGSSEGGNFIPLPRFASKHHLEQSRLLGADQLDSSSRRESELENPV